MIYYTLLYALCLICALLIVLLGKRKFQIFFFSLFNILFSIILFSNEMHLISLSYFFTTMGLSLVLIMFFTVKKAEEFEDENRTWRDYAQKIIGVISSLSFLLIVYLVLEKREIITGVDIVEADNETISQLFNEYYFPFGFIAFSILAIVYSLIVFIKDQK